EILRQVVEQPAVAGGVAAGFLVHSRAAAVEESDGETGLAEPAAGEFVPARVALDAVDHDQAGPGTVGGPGTAKTQPVAVAGHEFLDRVRLSQGASPCVP